MNQTVPGDARPQHTLIDQFRSKTERIKIHPSERALLGILCVHLVFIAWALGGMKLWSQQISLGLASVGFVVALLPRNYSSEHTGSAPFRLFTWPKLFRFPLFWLGLALMALIAIQGFNPAWAYTLTPDKKAWWMRPLAHVKWLPIGVEVPFGDGGGPWRALIIYASVWLTVCSAWIGFTRRRTLQFLFVVVAASGFLLALLGFAQRFIPSDKIFWSYTPSNAAFFSSFIYKNHGAGYLNLTLAVTCGMAAWFYIRGLRRMEKSNPAGIFIFMATAIAVSVLISYARGSTIAMLAFLTLTIIGFLYRQFTGPAEDRRTVVLVVLIIFFGVFLKTGLDAVNTGQAWTRLTKSFSDADGSLKSRQIATTASLDMLQEYGLMGVGAGGYRYLFPKFQQLYPEIFKMHGAQVFWEHAHNDWVEFPIELGVFGSMLIFAMAVCMSVVVLKSRAWQNPLSICILLGVVITVAHARWEFLFYCPAILLTACVLLVLAARWAEIEASGSKS